MWRGCQISIANIARLATVALRIFYFANFFNFNWWKCISLPLSKWKRWLWLKGYFLIKNFVSHIWIITILCVLMWLRKSCFNTLLMPRRSVIGWLVWILQHFLWSSQCIVIHILNEYFLLNLRRNHAATIKQAHAFISIFAVFKTLFTRTTKLLKVKRWLEAYFCSSVISFFRWVAVCIIYRLFLICFFEFDL